MNVLPGYVGNGKSGASQGATMPNSWTYGLQAWEAVMGMMLCIGSVTAVLCMGASPFDVVASLTQYPQRKRIRDGFINDLRELRPDIELTESDSERLLIRTRASLTRFELKALYRAVMHAQPCSEERSREIRAGYLRHLVSIVDSSAPQRQTRQVSKAA